MSKRVLSRLGFLVLVLSFPTAVVADVYPDSYLDIDTGYQWDKLLWSVSDEIDIEAYAVHHINSYRLGAKGAWAVCGSPWYFKASGHFGWVFSGNYMPADFQGDGLNGHTWDGSISTGYLFCMDTCWGVAPVLGWSYDKMDLNSKDTTSSTDINYGTVPIKSRLQGPFGGFDLFLQPGCCFILKLTYELHYAHWYGSADQPTFTGHHNKILGNIFQIDSSIPLRGCWEWGLALKYQTWKNNGESRCSFLEIDSKLLSMEWDSFSVMAHLGYAF